MLTVARPPGPGLLPARRAAPRRRGPRAGCAPSRRRSTSAVVRGHEFGDGPAVDADAQALAGFDAAQHIGGVVAQLPRGHIAHCSDRSAKATNARRRGGRSTHGRSAAKLGDDLVEHLQRRPPLDSRPRRAERLGIEQADFARAGEAGSQFVGGHDLGQVDQSARGRGHRMPSTVVTSSGRSGGPRWMTTPGMRSSMPSVGTDAESSPFLIRNSD
jgi:hypothetical protein